MDLGQAKHRLGCMGFSMKQEGNRVFGIKFAEDFDFSPHFILSPSNRDVTIGETSNGWFVNSYITFTARKRHETEEFQANILPIFAEGKTLNEAMEKFEIHYLQKKYNVYQANEGEAGLQS